MVDAKITALTEDTAPAITDIFASVEDPAGTPITKKVTFQKLADLFASLTQTLVGKTLTSPLFQGTVDGWVSANESWSYASASTITVPSGAASRYQKGDRIKWTQTTVKYGVIVAVADTLLTIAVNTDYVVTNAAISANYYSHQANPLGYPFRFNYVPTKSYYGGTTDPTSNTINEASFSLQGNLCHFQITATIVKGSGNRDFQGFTFPINRAESSTFLAIVQSYCAWGAADTYNINYSDNVGFFWLTTTITRNGSANIKGFYYI